MKTQQTLLLFFISLLFLNLTCRKENTAQLPPETTTGAMTFGCKIDGKVLLPRDGNGAPGLFAEYLFLGNGTGGGWFLNIYVADRVGNPRKSVGLGTDSLLLLQGKSYSLKKMKGFADGRCLIDIITYQMNSTDTGELFITKHDQVLRILSGRFSFTASRSTGEKIQITEGRFDIRY